MNTKKITTLDKYSGYFTVFPCDFLNGKEPVENEPYLYISEECPEDLKNELLADWEKVKKETIERHENGEYSSNDYFW